MVLLTWSMAGCFVPAGRKPDQAAPLPEAAAILTPTLTPTPVYTLPLRATASLSEAIWLGLGGYDFEGQRHFPAQTSPGDCDLVLQKEAGEPVMVAYSGTLFDQVPRILDAGPAPLQPVGPAPTAGYRLREKAVEGHVYWLRTRAGGLVRFRVERISRREDGSPEVEIRFIVVKKELSPCCGER